jgi:hypothetical protein
MTNIKWNEVTWYSKILAAIIFVALPFVGFYYGVQYGKIQAPSVVTPEVVPATVVTAASDYYKNPAEWQTDANNTQGGFSIAYPIDFNAQDNNVVKPVTNWMVGATTTGSAYFTLTVPKAFEPQTNLADVSLTVGSSKNTDAVAQCLSAAPSNGPATQTSTVVINGAPFTIFHSSDAGAGNYYQTTSYRTVKAGQCYAIEYTIHSSQIANYPASYNLKPFDQAKIDVLMQNIIGTFTFSNEQNQ